VEKTILILDDDAIFRSTLLRTKLEEWGYRVLEAGKAREAVAIVTENRVDLMIVDGLLPDKTGVEFIQAVREVGYRTPIIFISALFKDMSTYQQLSDLAVDHVMQKPIEIEDLRRRITAIFADPGSTDA
jgi:DNA-binding response OmpR family regulator